MASNEETPLEMQKIVINRAYGGFPCNDEIAQIVPEVKDTPLTKNVRTNPYLIKAIEDNNGKLKFKYAKLKVVAISKFAYDHGAYTLTEYDGLENIKEDQERIEFLQRRQELVELAKTSEQMAKSLEPIINKMPASYTYRYSWDGSIE